MRCKTAEHAVTWAGTGRPYPRRRSDLLRQMLDSSICGCLCYQLEVHIREECPATEVQCEYKNLGCVEVVRANLYIKILFRWKCRVNTAIKDVTLRSFTGHSKLVNRLKISWSYIEKTNCAKSMKHVFFQATCFSLT